MILLGQNSYASYQALSEHPVLQGKLDNPFKPDLLGKGVFFNPWGDQVWVYFIWLVVIGAVLLWVYHRVNETELYQQLGWLTLAWAFFFVLFFRAGHPHPVGMVLLTALGVGVLACLAAVLTVVAVQKLPYFGVEERWLTDPTTGEVRPQVPFVVAGVMVFGGSFLMSTHAVFLHTLLSHWPGPGAAGFFYWVVLLLVVGLAGFLAGKLLPWREVPGQTVLGGATLRELAPMFTMKGTASRGEVVVVGLSAFLIYVGSLFAFKGARDVTGADIAGVVCVSFLAFLIIRAELIRAARLEQPAEVTRSRTPWS